MKVPDPWEHLRQFTTARIALGRAGASLPTAAWLDFRLAHALARDAVHAPFDPQSVFAALKQLQLEGAEVDTEALDRRTYLLRPQLGRSLAVASRQTLERARTQPPPDIALIVADGLSATAVHAQAAAFLLALVPMLRERNISIAAPVAIVRHARVGVQDPIGAALGARAALVIIGERPGLGSADSLGAYYVLEPGPGKSDADRNCISNIRDGGLPPAAAAAKAFWLITESLRRGISGVALKDETTAALPP